MSTHAIATAPAPHNAGSDARPASRNGIRKALLTNRIVLLGVLIVALIILFSILSALGVTTAPYNSDYLASALINLVPLAMLALAETFVIISGAGGIDLSIGSIVSLVGMIFGFMYGLWGWPLIPCIIIALLLGAVLGAVNGALVAYVGLSPLIATLATYYAYWSIALVINKQMPISTEPIQDLYSLSANIELPIFGAQLPLVPKGVFIFLIPTVIVVWLVLAKTSYGRRLYAIGTNDTASAWSGINVAATRAWSYIAAGAIAGLVAVVTVSQFASARPDAGTSGNGMAMPAITMAVLGGIAVTGGAGRTSGTVLAALLIVWMNAGILITFQGNLGSQVQLLALGVILVGSALLNILLTRRYGGSR